MREMAFQKLQYEKSITKDLYSKHTSLELIELSMYKLSQLSSLVLPFYKRTKPLASLNQNCP